LIIPALESFVLNRGVHLNSCEPAQEQHSFPLPQALSLVEREPRIPSLGVPEGPLMSDDGRAILPLLGARDGVRGSGVPAFLRARKPRCNAKPGARGPALEDQAQRR